MTQTADADIRVRSLRESDVETIIGIDALITGEEKPGFWRGLLTIYEPTPPADEEEEGGGAQASPAEGRPRPTYFCEVAESGGRVIGFILGDVQSWKFGIPRCGRIIVIGVHPDHRRFGVATRLSQELLQTFRKMNLPFVQCLVKPGDPLGEFFSSLGFERSPWITMEKGLS